MAAVAILAGGYAAYRLQKKIRNNALTKNDPEINFDDPSLKKVTLLEWEQELSIMERPISTITFYNGNYKNVSDFLENRVNEILVKNPWLTGFLAWDKKDKNQIKLFYNDTEEQEQKEMLQRHFQVMELPISREKTKYKEYTQMLESKDAIVPFNIDLIGTTKPIWKVVVVPDADKPLEKFALVVSMTHAVADSYTYYKVYSMLDKTSTDAVIALDPNRLLDVKDALAKKLGSNRDVEFLSTALDEEPPVDVSGSKKETKVMKLFAINDDWISQNNGDDGNSLFREDTTATTSGNSANSIVASWFFKLNEANIGLMPLNLRNRVDVEGSETKLSDNHAGSYVYPIIYTPADYESAELIEQSLVTFKRCAPTTPKRLPTFHWGMTSSMCVNWSPFYAKAISLTADTDDISIEMHLPIWDVRSREMFANRVSVLNLFTVCPETKTGTAKAGAFVLCSESTWGTIEASGIVEKVIADIPPDDTVTCGIGGIGLLGKSK